MTISFYDLYSCNSDESFIRGMEGQGSSASKELSKALKGVKLWYIKQCTQQSDETVMRDLLLPFMEPIILRIKV